MSVAQNVAVATTSALSVQQLVSLRLALRAAILGVASAGRYQRGAAIVALDAVVERATALVAVDRGLPLPANAKLDDLISRVKEDLGAAWTPTVLPDIRLLRRARNAAQHDGLEPDPSHLPVWAAATSLYVKSLISGHFSIDIDRVILADAVVDPTLKALLREAEKLHAIGEDGRCVEKAGEAYRIALARWKQMAGDRRSPSRPLMTSDILDRRSYDDLKGRIEQLQGFDDAAIFATGGAEAEWFTQAIREPADVLDSNDAERVLAYVFEWLTGFEQAFSSWTTDRRRRADVAARVVRKDGGPAKVDSLDVILSGVGRAKLEIRLIDVPHEDAYDEWMWHLSSHLTRPNIQAHWTVNMDGTVTRYIESEQLEQLPGDLVELAAALVEVEHFAESVRAAQSDAERRLAERKQSVEAELGSAKTLLPDWIKDIKAVLDPGLREDHWNITLDAEAANLRFGLRSNNHHYDRQRLTDLIRAHHLVEVCYWTAGVRDFAIAPLLSGAELVEVLSSVEEQVQAGLAAMRAEEQEQTRRLTAVRAALAERLTHIAASKA